MKFIDLNTRREISYLQATMYYFVYLIKHTNNEVFADFPKIFDHFPNISEDFRNVVRWPKECFRTFPKESEEYRRLLRKMFQLNIDKLWLIQH